MYKIILVFIGGALGSAARYLLSTSVYNIAGRSFPYGTLAVNLIGSFFIGFVFMLITQRFTTMADSLQALIIFGFIGGFTTFSAFAFETFALLQNGELIRALANVIFSCVFCVIAVWLGMLLAKIV